MSTGSTEIIVPPPRWGWWCPECKQWLRSSEVTYEETHDSRCGGCGEPVRSQKGEP
jgi:hypothetical protein